MKAARTRNFRSSRRISQTGKQNRKPNRCLFYGLSQPVGHTFIDKKDGRCALLPHEGRCKREKSGEAVDWKQCHFFNTSENGAIFECIIAKYKVLPHGQIEPVPLKDWFTQVMRQG